MVLLDWGLAKINDDTGMYEVDGQSEPGDLHNVGKTLAGRVLGTPLYMAPEQAAGRLEEVDHLTDIYGLGGILFAILTGVAPHEEAFEKAGSKQSASDIFSTILSRKMRTPMQLVPDVPVELDAICRKALQPKRYLRYDSASDLADDVQRYIAGESVTAYEAPPGQRLRRWMSRHPTMSQLFLLLTSLLMIGGGAIVYTAHQGKLALQQARHAGLMDITREIEASLRFDVQELAQDVNFITDLPLTQTVVRSRNVSSDTSPTASLNDAADRRLDEVSAEEWLERHGSLLEGLLRANPAYLVMGTYEIGPRIAELIRFERNNAGSTPYRIPSSQLASLNIDDVDNAEMQQFRPGHVTLTTGDQLEEQVPTKNRSAVNLAAVSPIFDERTGELYGVNVIELDLRERLHQLLLAASPDDVTVYITDAVGNEVFSFHDGTIENFPGNQSIAERFPELRSFFTQSTHTEFQENPKLYATVVPLSGELPCKAVIGIVVELVDN